ncbi:unnamed protein product [Zymoseptoria tritici ST99CH_1E4]|uniref:Thioesterase domain-containing protein n=1 Tax=Zymoseptoria tritici ST99CH_1E4 TaxID=1276532 RepID=A0A2H1FPE2_ZYMTR|nr:unnamed protein product [Zymoseptoria tritici ST99CH_1E4]
MALLLSRRAFSAILDTPPGLRSVIARQVFASQPQHPFAARGVLAASAISRTYKLQRRSQSTSATPLPPTDTTTAPPTTPPLRPSRILRILTTSSLVLAFFTVGFIMGSAPAAEAVNGYLHSPSDEESLTLFKPTTPRAEEVNFNIVNHPLAVALRADPTMTESRPHLKIPESMRAHNLTCGPLMGEEKIEVPPLMFTSKEAELPASTQIFYLGPALCGHPGIVHGGLLATLMDEGLARACFPALPNKIGVTASLKIDYKRPCPGSSYIALKAETTKVEGRKAWVKGWIEVIGEDGEGDGVHVVEAEALFIEPKHAAKMVRLYGAP